MQSWSVEQKRAAKDLFGRPLRVVLAAWIVQRSGKPFFLQEAQDAMRISGEAPSGVAKELRAFVAHHMLLQTPDARRVYFTPLDHSLWPVFGAAAAAFELLEMTGNSDNAVVDHRFSSGPASSATIDEETE